MNEVLYNGISLAALVLGVVQVLKKTGICGNTVQWVAIGLAFLVFSGGKAAEAFPQGRLVYEVLLAGLYGVSASGIYDVFKTLRPSPRREYTPPLSMSSGTTPGEGIRAVSTFVRQ